MERRTFLSTGSASVLALAAAPPSVGAEAAGDGPAAVVREYYRRANAAETTREFAAQIPQLSHGASPLPGVAADAPEAFSGVPGQELVDASVVEEDISAGQVRDISAFLAASLSDEAVATIAGDNAVVAVTLETDDAVGGRVGKEWLVAPEDGEWRLVWSDERDGPRAAARTFFHGVKTAENAGGALEEPVAEFTYSASPLGNVADYTPWYIARLRRQELLGTEVVSEDVDKREIASKFAPLTGWISPGEIEAIAEENAVVAVSLRDEALGVEEFVQEWLVAPNGSGWQLVWF